MDGARPDGRAGAADPGRRRSRSPGAGRGRRTARRARGPGAPTCPSVARACARRRVGRRARPGPRGAPGTERRPARYAGAAGAPRRAPSAGTRCSRGATRRMPSAWRHHAGEERSGHLGRIVLALRLLEHDDGDAARRVGGRESREVRNVTPRHGIRRTPAFCAVPVLPATAKPGIAAFGARAALDDADEDVAHRARRRLRDDAHGLGDAATGSDGAARRRRSSSRGAAGRAVRRWRRPP